MTRPSDYPPPWSSAEAIAEPSDPEPIEVGVLVVGAGPAGLAAAIRLGQLAAEDPETAARLGEVPVAVLEKGKTPGSHLLSGAVIDPGPLAGLLGEGWRERVPAFGDVSDESVLFLTKRRSFRFPTPPTMRNHGNVVVSLSRLGRALAMEAEGLGVAVLPETAAQQLLVAADRVVGVHTGDKGRGRDGEELGRFEPGSDVTARVTILAEGTQGHLTGAALERFGLAGDSPQVWALGVKEVWKVTRPLDRVLHTLGWPLRAGRRFREFGGSFVYPLGDDLVAIGMVVGLDYRDAELSLHDLLQELKTHPRIRPILDGGERVEWGAKTIPEGGFVALPRRFHAPGLLLCGDGVGLVNVPALKGVHYAIESGRLAAEAAWRSLAGEGLGSYDSSLRDSFLWRELHEVRNMRQAFGSGFWLGGARAAAITATPRPAAGRKPADRARRRAESLPDESGVVVSGSGRRAHLRQALLRVPVREPDARRPAESPPGRDARATGARRALDAHVPRAGLRGRRRARRRHRRRAGLPVQLRPVRRDHGQGRPPDSSGGRLGPGVHADVITSVDNQRVKEVLRLRKGRERRRSGLFIAEGPREVERAAAAGLRLVSIYYAPELLDWPEGEEVSARVLERMSYRGSPEGVLAIVEAPVRELPRDGTLLLVAVGIEKPGNLGAMARSAHAAGADALVVADAEADIWNPNAIRASTGAIFALPVVEATLDEVRALDLQLVAAVVDAETAYTRADLARPTALVVGSEDAGLAADWRAAADLEVSIPMHDGSTDSLNTATAAAILLFEAVRQRG